MNKILLLFDLLCFIYLFSLKSQELSFAAGLLTLVRLDMVHKQHSVFMLVNVVIFKFITCLWITFFLFIYFSGIIRRTAEVVALVTLVTGLTIQYSKMRLLSAENLKLKSCLCLIAKIPWFWIFLILNPLLRKKKKGITITVFLVPFFMLYSKLCLKL